MSLLIDMKTILITLVVGHIFTVILISSYWQKNLRDSTLNTFFLAKCIQAVAWLLIALRGGIADIFTISIANSLLFIGSAFESIALLKLIGKFHTPIKKVYITLTVAFIVSFHIILVYCNYEPIRIACSSFGTSILIFLPAYQLIRGKCSTRLMQIMGFLYYLTGLSFVIRGIAALSSAQAMGLFTPGIIQTISFLALYLIMILGNTGFILILKERADAVLIHMANFDDLTQIYNRRTFISKAKEMIEKSAKIEKPISFVLFDVDNFKKFNDEYGHDVGDRILQDLTERIRDFLEPQDLFGRYGGDEFAILFQGLNETEAISKLEKMAQLVAQPKVKGISEKYSLSIGVITLIPDKQTELESLYVNCDKALYEAKRNGRNCIYSIG